MTTIRALALLAFAGVAGCNTIAGVGADISDGAHAVQGML